MLNLHVMMGRLVHDPELNWVGEKKDIAKTRYTVAVERQYNRKQVDYIDCVAWRGTAEFVAKYFKKGQMILTVGTLQKRSYTDAHGNEKWVTEHIADNVSFCGSKAESGGADTSEGKDKALDTDALDGLLEDDELPF